jgi:hypothetical protein
MKIDITELAKCAEKNYDFKAYIALRVIEDGVNYIFPNEYFTEIYNNLKANHYIYSETQLTPKAKELLKEISEVKMSKKVDTGVNQLYIACQEELLKITGKKQKTSKINGKSYSFLPNFVDFQDKIEKTCKKYQLNDKEQLKKVLLQYINKCNKEDNWFPILEYYIMKDNKSKLATDYISFEEKQEETEVKIEPKDIKNLF